MEKNNKKTIKSFRDLEVYQNTYEASVIIATRLLPKLPESEKYDLRDQLSRSSKAVPRLIAEGFAKKHQKSGLKIEDVRRRRKTIRVAKPSNDRRSQRKNWEVHFFEI